MKYEINSKQSYHETMVAIYKLMDNIAHCPRYQLEWSLQTYAATSSLNILDTSIE